MVWAFRLGTYSNSSFGTPLPTSFWWWICAFALVLLHSSCFNVRSFGLLRLFSEGAQALIAGGRRFAGGSIGRRLGVGLAGLGIASWSDAADRATLSFNSFTSRAQSIRYVILLKMRLVMSMCNGEMLIGEKWKPVGSVRHCVRLRI